MEILIIVIAISAIALIWFTARPKARRNRRHSDTPRLWDNSVGSDSVGWFGLWGSGDSNAHNDSGHSHHDGGHNCGTNTPSDGGHFDSGHGGFDGAGDAGHGH